MLRKLLFWQSQTEATKSSQLKPLLAADQSDEDHHDYEAIELAEIVGEGGGSSPMFSNPLAEDFMLEIDGGVITDETHDVTPSSAPRRDNQSDYVIDINASGDFETTESTATAETNSNESARSTSNERETPVAASASCSDPVEISYDDIPNIHKIDQLLQGMVIKRTLTDINSIFFRRKVVFNGGYTLAITFFMAELLLAYQHEEYNWALVGGMAAAVTLILYLVSDWMLPDLLLEHSNRLDATADSLQTLKQAVLERSISDANAATSDDDSDEEEIDANAATSDEDEDLDEEEIEDNELPAIPEEEIEDNELPAIQQDLSDDDSDNNYHSDIEDEGEPDTDDEDSIFFFNVRPRS